MIESIILSIAMLPGVMAPNAFTSAITPEPVVIERSVSVVGNGQCVDYIKQRIGYYGQVISAKNMWENAEEFGFVRIPRPVVGAIVYTDEGPVGHVAFIELVTDATIHISEQNIIPLQYGERTLSRDDVRIIGYFIYPKEK